MGYKGGIMIKRYFQVIILSVFLLLLFMVVSCAAEMVTTQWGGDAEIAYDTGFMHMLRKHPEGGVCLFTMDIIENDSPGAGLSEKGVSQDRIWGNNHARKVFNLDDMRAHKAWLVVILNHQGKYPLSFTINGNRSQFDNWDQSKNTWMVRWIDFPVKWLRKGKNIIELSSPEAATQKEGWGIDIARADEFEAGGGNPADVGKTSFKSTNGGKSWKESPFGPEGKTRAEYSIRLSFDRSVKSGWLATPVLDLWKGDSQAIIVPLREIKKMHLETRAGVPQGSKIEYYLRKGLSPDPHATSWEPYELIGSGATFDYETGGADLNRRYVQIKAVLTTTNPLVSPVVKSINVTAELLERVPLHQNIRVVEADNPPIKYSSINWEWEKWDRPEFKEIRMRENLDEVTAGSRTEFDAQVKILDYVTKRWYYDFAVSHYPGWDALSILERVDNLGFGGMCIQYNNVIGGMCMAYGWQARLVNIIGHEIIEVWNDEFGKWILLDGAYNWHNMNVYHYDPVTAEPLSMLDLHDRYLDYYFPGRTMDWQKDLITFMELKEGKPTPIKRGTLTPEREAKMTGFVTAGAMRMVPRNNWYEKPYPRPLNHGRSWWPWNGYINWYDTQTPPQRQYSWYTDRPRDMWPDLNTVHIDATSAFGNDRLFLRFETYTPNFCHYEIDVDDTGWEKTGERYTWLPGSGRNTIRVRVVNKLGAQGKPSVIVVNHGDAPFGD